MRGSVSLHHLFDCVICESHVVVADARRHMVKVVADSGRVCTSRGAAAAAGLRFRSLNLSRKCNGV